VVHLCLFLQEADANLLMSCSDDGPIHLADHDTSVATSVEQPESSVMPPLTAHSEKLTPKLSNSGGVSQPKKFSSGSTVLVKSQGSSKLLGSKVMLLKHSLLKSSTNLSPAQAAELGVSAAVPTKKKSVRPAAWLLHSIGLRMVREKVYDDLIEIQEEKDSEGLLTGNEQKQLGRLRGAFDDLVRQNKPFRIRTRRRCGCGFSAGSRLELELHRDYGSVLSGDDYRYCCCLCGLSNVRSPLIMVAHIGRIHGRQSHIQTIPTTGFCPYCPYEQRTAAKIKLSRHVINCALTFRIDQNLAPIAADADIPLFEVDRPPVSSIQTTTSTTTAASDAGLKPVVTVKPPASSAVPTLSGACTTVSVAGPVMTPAESSPSVTTTTGKTQLAKLARLAPLPEGLGFEICELCGAFLANRDSMIFHMIRAHKLVLPEKCRTAEKPIVSCDKCTERFWTTVALDVHQGEMHSGKPEPATPPTTICPLCKRTRLTDVLEHLARQHRITLVDMFAQRYCSVCQLSLHAARPFANHMLTRHSDLFSDHASLYAAIVLVDRATRGRVGMVSRGRQLSVLSGATSKPLSNSAHPGKPCPICLCEFADDEQVKDHVLQVHRFACMHCGRRCGSAEFLSYHVETVHSNDTTSCQLCGAKVSILAMEEHLANSHIKSCSVSLTQVKDDLSAQAESRKRRRGSTSSTNSEDSLNDDEHSGSADETQPTVKKLKAL